MYGRRFISVLTAALAVGICVFITWISRGVEISSLAINLGFLGIMIIAILISLFTGLLKLTRISRALSRAADSIRESDSEESTLLQNQLFDNKFLDGCYAQYRDMVSKHPNGSCDISDFINEDAIETYIHRGFWSWFLIF